MFSCLSMSQHLDAMVTEVKRKETDNLCRILLSDSQFLRRILVHMLQLNLIEYVAEYTGHNAADAAASDVAVVLITWYTILKDFSIIRV